MVAIGHWKTGGLAALSLLGMLALARPAAAGSANDAALAAWQVNQDHCAAVGAGESVELTAGGMEFVLPVWQQVDQTYKDTKEAYLLYWRAVLALCVQQGNLAGQDLQDFLCAEGANPMFDDLTNDARTRLRRMGIEDRCAEKNRRLRTARQRAEARAARQRAAQQRPLVSIGLGGGYQLLRTWSYGALAGDITVRLVGPLRLGAFVRPSIGARLRAGDGEYFEPARHAVLTTIAVGPVLQAKGAVEPFVGVAFQLSPNVIGSLGPPVLVGPVLMGGVELPLLPLPIAIRPTGEIGLAGPFLSVRGLVEVVARIPDPRKGS